MYITESRRRWPAKDKELRLSRLSWRNMFYFVIRPLSPNGKLKWRKRKKRPRPSLLVWRKREGAAREWLGCRMTLALVYNDHFWMIRSSNFALPFFFFPKRKSIRNPKVSLSPSHTRGQIFGGENCTRRKANEKRWLKVWQIEKEPKSQKSQGKVKDDDDEEEEGRKEGRWRRREKLEKLGGPPIRVLSQSVWEVRRRVGFRWPSSCALLEVDRVGWLTDTYRNKTENLHNIP
jgi:hypothetical protein